MALIGCDISRHNLEYVKRNVAIIRGMHFVMMKATEGTTWVDPYMKYYALEFKEHTRIGFYHYARPDNNSAKSEAEHFVRNVGRFAGSAMYALDWEGNATKTDVAWALEWLEQVKYMTGVKPLIYLPKSELKKMDSVAAADYGLWIADWDNVGKVDERYLPWKICAMKQYKDSPIDLDVFNGSAEAWNKYIAADWKK